nr:hypothetical protein [uncultured bacterium]
MMENTEKKSTSAWVVILFWASIWGIAEATLGWILHMSHTPGVGYILFPIALLCMTSAISQTGKTRSAVYVALGAAVIKLSDLFLLGGCPFFYVTNPAVYIALEGVATAIFFQWTERFALNSPARYLKAFGVGLVSLLTTFVAFKCWQAGMSEFVTHNPGVDLFWHSSRLYPAALQLITESLWLTGALWLSGIFSKKGSLASRKISPALAGLTGMVAVILTMVTF